VLRAIINRSLRGKQVRLDRILIALIVVILATAAAVLLTKRSGPDARPPAVTAVGTAGGTLELLVVGIDALEPGIVERLTGEGRLPNLSRVMSEGAVAHFPNLGKDMNPKIAWTSLVTGLTPERQGIGGKRMSRRGELVDAPLTPAARTGETIWTILSEAGESVGVLGWPATWPAENLNGIVFGSYEQYILERRLGGDPAAGVSPPSALAWLDPLVIDPETIRRRDLARFVDTESELGLEGLIGQNLETAAVAIGGDRSIVAIAKQAVDAGEAGNLVVYLGGVNLMSQRFWHYMEPLPSVPETMDDNTRELYEQELEALSPVIDRYYEFVDELLGELLELLHASGTIAIVADHGYVGVRLDASGHPMIGTEMHSEYGFMVLAGPRVVAGARWDEGSFFDVAPTIMSAASLNVPGDLDGAPMSALLRN
jgi:hypothetical protein